MKTIISSTELGCIKDLIYPKKEDDEKWNTDPPFQRALVWSQAQKQELILNLKKGYP